MRTLFVALTFITTSTFACPDLRGTYPVCRSITDGSIHTTDTTVTQVNQNGVTTYTVTSTDPEMNETATESYRADGKVVVKKFEDTESGMTLETATIAMCTGKVLNINVNVTLNGENLGMSSMKVSKSGTKLIIDTVDMSEEGPQTNREICE